MVKWIIIAPLEVPEGLEKGIAAGDADAHGENEEHTFTIQSIADLLEDVKFGEQDRLKALQSMIVSMKSVKISSSVILDAVNAYLKEVLGQ